MTRKGKENKCLQSKKPRADLSAYCQGKYDADMNYTVDHAQTKGILCEHPEVKKRCLFVLCCKQMHLQ